MRTKLPVGVVRERSRHGKVVYYYRDAKGPRTRLPDIADPNFREAYKAVLIGEVYKPAITETIQSGTLSWLVQEYSLSLHFRSLDPVTQRRRQ